ncbi:MAG TPA: HlyD family secretion protein [Gemmatimonadaceae bacterium]|nr:HlyD family secretion protein [Gemmatimonadaceae bacterium]
MASESGTKRKIIILIVIVVAVVAAIWGFRTWSYSRSHESTDDAQVDGHIVPVLAKVGGYVTSVAADENQHVNENQILVTLDDAEYRVRVESAQADLAAAQGVAGTRTTEGQAEGQVATASGQRSQLDAQVIAAQAANTNAQANLARMKDLAAKQIVSKQQLDAAQAAAAAAEAQLLAAQRQVTTAGSQISTAQAGVRIAEARSSAAQAALDNAKLQLSYTRITAPASGLVARKQVEVGQLVTAGQPVMSIVADTGMWVTANFKETQLNDIRVGQPVEFDVDAYGGCTARGKVESLSGATGAKFALLPPDNATGNFTKVVQRVPIRIAVTKGCPDHPLRPGLSVNVHVATQ